MGISEGTRILFVGVGTFIVIFFAVICLLLCLLGLVLKRPWCVRDSNLVTTPTRYPTLPAFRLYAVSVATLIVVVLSVVLTPRAPPGGLTNASPVYSTYYIGVTLMAVLMFGSALGAIGCVAALTLRRSTHVRVIRD